MSLDTGATLQNRFQILRPLGAGGFGAAYLAQDQQLKRECVIKEATSHDDGRLQEFGQEAQILAALRHANLPIVYDFFVDAGSPYLVIEYIAGQTLDQLSRGRTAPFETGRVLRWADDLLAALTYLHTQTPPIIHRDIKPANVCITPDDKAVLLDFGIARRLDQTHTRTGAQAFSPCYSPIEQILRDPGGNYPSLKKYRNDLLKADVHTGPYSDIYSLAATLYYCFTLCNPPSACLRVTEDGLRPLAELNPDVPLYVCQALERAMVVDPGQRCQSALELSTLLRDPSALPHLPAGKKTIKENKAMYTAEISRVNPTCFLFLIDQSYSMSDPFGGGAIQASKAAMLADAVNRLLDTLIGRSSKGSGVWRYFEVGVVGYGNTVGSAYGGPLAGRDLAWIDEIADNPLRVEDRVRKVSDGAGGLIEMNTKFPVWFEASAGNGTPMVRAMWHAHSILESWVAQHLKAFPPVVINITDGESSDGDPTPVSEAIRELATEDGNVLLLNLHLSSQRASTIFFPDSAAQLPDDYARLLFEMSSLLPDAMRHMAQEKRYNVSAASRGFVFNADITDVIEFLEIGTRAANMR